jgi:ATP-dependent Clp protease ATP-binding subunit ClpC
MYSQDALYFPALRTLLPSATAKTLSMEFLIQCLVTRHPSGRVTYTPLHLPTLAYHTTTPEGAEEDLALAINDRIERAHPGSVSNYAHPTHSELKTLYVDALTVWHAGGTDELPMRLNLVVSPARKPFVEIRSLHLDLRIWLPAGDDVLEKAAPYFQQHLRRMSEHKRLAARVDGDQNLTTLNVSAEPTLLSTLKRKELHQDERLPPLPDDLAPPPDLTKKKKRDDFDDEDDERSEREKKKRPATPTLARIGVALHKLAEKNELLRAWEVDTLIDNLIARIKGKKPEPVVLVGDAGSGKTTIVHEVVRRLFEATREKKEERRPFFQVDGSRLIAGEGFFGDWQQQTFDCFEEARRAEAILYLGHVVELLDAGKSAHSDHNVSQLMAPMLSAREVCVIGEATPEEWARIERRSASFAQAWSVLRVAEVSDDIGRRILDRVAKDMGDSKGIAVEADAVESALRLTRRFRPYGAVVGNTVAFLRRVVDACAHTKELKVSGHDAVAHFSSESGIPLVLLRDDMALDSRAVVDFLATRVKGQLAAVERVAEIVAVIKAGLADRRRPVGVLLFAGPTGVGKTELTKGLAEFVFGGRERMVRLDMGEYASGDALSRLLGEGSGGTLTAAVRRQPFCVVLLDEIEKAHPVVFDALLGVLGEGRLTDSSGKFTDFRNAIVVMTSNLGADTLRSRVGFGEVSKTREIEVARQHYRTEAERFFRPELFNRIDDFIVFSPLSRDVLSEIVTREVEKVRARDGVRRHNVELSVDARAMDVLADHGFDPRYGARPLKRTLERELALPIATRLASRPELGNVRVEVTAEGEYLSLRTTTLRSREEGAATRSLHALESAGQLRAEVRRWARSNLVSSLRGDVHFFAKASQAPGFWKERALAEMTARRAENARTMIQGIDDLATQAEALEDLAFESWYERRDDNAAALETEVADLRRLLAPRKWELFATMFPSVERVVVYLAAGRGAWARVPELTEMYSAWCQTHGLTVKAYTCHTLSDEERAKLSKDEKDRFWRWNVGHPPYNHQPLPVAAALVISGGPARFAFSAEEGVYRFLDGTGTSVVKIRFEPTDVHSISQLRRFDKLDPLMPTQETRRVSISKNTFTDSRTTTERPWSSTSTQLSPMFDDWMEHRVFGADADVWR